jgi:hypothetical protein
MWLINNITGEEGWHICQLYSKQDSSLLVFVKEGGIWRTKLWNNQDTRIRAKNHAEEVRDDYAMIQSGFFIGTVKDQRNMKECAQCDGGHFLN